MKRLFLSVVAYCALLFSVVAGGQEVVFSDGFDPVTITNLSATPNPVAPGESTTLSWATLSANSCEATSPSDEFNGSVATSGSVQVTIATTGSWNYTLVCQGISGPAIKTLTITTRDDVVSITSFTASPNPVEAGQEITISWDTQYAESCEATADFVDFDGPVDTSGSVLMTLATVGSHDFTLTCEGFAGPATEILTITVKEPTSVSNCDPPPLSGSIGQWRDVFDVEFPAPIYDNELVGILSHGYFAIEFATGDVIDDGYLATVGNTRTKGTRLGAVSECPGNFDVTPECDHSWGIGGGINWSTNNKDGACKLKPNTTYYFNVTFTDGFDSSKTTCIPQYFGAGCVATIQPVNRN